MKKRWICAFLVLCGLILLPGCGGAAGRKLSRVPLQTGETAVTPELLERLNVPQDTPDLRTRVWTGPVVYTAEGTLDGQPVRAYSLPYVVYSYSNVNSSPGAWTVCFQVAEMVEYAGETLHGQTPFRYGDVDIRLAAGAHTVLTQVDHDIAVQQSGARSDSLKVGLLQAADAQALQRRSDAQRAEALAAMTPQTEKTTRSGGFGLPERTFAAGEALTAGFLAENRGTSDSGDRFWMRFVPVYEGDGTAADTTALLRVSFTVRSARDKTMQTAVSTGDLALPYHAQPN